MFRKLLVATLAIALPLKTQAQDALAFEGFYGGVQVGYYWPEISPPGGDFGSGNNVALFGGYNHAFAGDWILGAELQFGTSLEFGVSPAMEYTLEDMIQLRGRVGHVIGDTMVFASLGYLDSSLSNNFGAPFQNADGYTYGLGVEHLVNPTTSIRIEYIGSDLNLEGGGSLDLDGINIGLAIHF